MHPLLERQLRKLYGSLTSVPPELTPLLGDVELAYVESDRRQRQLEHSLELTFEKLLARNQALREDIAARSSIESALRAQEREFRDVIQSIPVGVLILRAHRIVFVNAALVRSLGYADASELVGAEWRERLSPDARGSGDLPSSDAINELEWRSRDGLQVSFHLELAQEIQYEGTRAVLLVARDVSELKQLTARLQVADRMASMGTLAAGVAHEINNPLAYLTSNLHFLQDELRQLTPAVPGERLSELLTVVSEAATGAERVRTIVRDLKAFSRSGDDEDEVHACDVHDVLRSAVALARAELRHRATLRTAFGRIPLVRGNDGRLGQVFLNLLVNAAQAIDAGAVDQNWIDLSTRVEGDSVVVEVRDTGHGMSPAVLARIFDPFYTTKPVGVGTGLGLSICHGILGRLGGAIEVESTPGRGSTFRVRLGIWDDATPERSSTEVSPRPLAHPLRLLVIDDEAAMGISIKRVLEGEHQVRVLTSARDALMLLSAGERFDAILCDLMMPQLTGMQFYREVHARWPSLAPRIVLMTGGAFGPEAASFSERSDIVRLEKPLNLDTLRDTLARVAAA